MRIIYLSPRVSHEAPVWPGDEPFSIAPRWSIDSGDAVTVGTVTTTAHIGAHIDAPAHIVGSAPSIEATPLDACVGRCLIVDVSDLVDRSSDPHRPAPVERVRERVLGHTRGETIERLLLRHYAEQPSGWHPALPGIEPELVEWFAAQRGRLLGVDLASFDPAECKDLLAHRAGIAGGFVLLEGLDLSAAPEGEAELIALPLPWAGADASPVRAVLRLP